jgi:aryl-alcohol dehydrogenase
VINSLVVKAGASLAVLGTGTVGLAAVMAARLVKARPIIAVDKNRRRLRLALELGATRAVLTGRGSLGGQVRAVTGAGVDYLVESTAASDLERLAGGLLNSGGKAALLSGATGPGRLPEGREVRSVIQGDAHPAIRESSLRVFMGWLGGPNALMTELSFPKTQRVRFGDAS